MAIPRKGMREIHTLSGRVDQVAVPYKAYMQVTCLEMEKLRRRRERNSAHQRIADLDARLGEIEAEKESLLRAVGERISDEPTKAESAGPRTSTGGFKFRY